MIASRLSYSRWPRRFISITLPVRVLRSLLQRCMLVPRNFTIAPCRYPHRLDVHRIKDQRELILRLGATAKYRRRKKKREFIIMAIDNGVLVAKFTEGNFEISRNVHTGKSVSLYPVFMRTCCRLWKFGNINDTSRCVCTASWRWRRETSSYVH